MALYEKRYGVWRERVVPLFSEPHWEECRYVPSAVREAGRHYSHCRVEYDYARAYVVRDDPFGEIFTRRDEARAEAAAALVETASAHPKAAIGVAVGILALAIGLKAIFSS